MADKEEQLEIAVKDAVKSFGAELIEYRLLRQGPGQIVRCVVDYACGGITIEQCSLINRKIVSFLENENLFGSDFAVEVNSPGLDRPLKTKNDFLRVKGKMVSLWFNREVEGNNFIEAKMLGADDSALLVEFNGKELKIDIDTIKIGKAKIEIK